MAKLVKIRGSIHKSTYTPRYFVSWLWVVVYLAVTIFATQGLSLFDPGGVTNSTDLEFYLLFVSSIILGLGLIAFGMRYFKVKINWVLLGFAIVLLAIDIVAVELFPDHVQADPSVFTEYQCYFDITNSLRSRLICGWVAGLLGLYVFLTVFPKIFRSHRTLDFWLWVGVCVAAGLIIASFFVDADTYRTMFTVKHSEVTDPDFIFPRPSSITNGPNTFGFAVLWGVMCALILHAKYRRFPLFLIGVFYLLMLMLIGSKTCIFACGVMGIIYVVWSIITGWKKRRRQQIALICFLVAIGGLVALFFLLPVESLKAAQETIGDYFEKMANLSGGDFTGRVSIWKEIWKHMKANPTFLVIGTGDGVWEYFVAAITNWCDFNLGCSHNGFYMVLGRFGFIGLAIYLAMIVWIIIKIARAIKVYKEKWAWVLYIILIGIIINSLWEDTALLNFELKGIMTLGVTFLPAAISEVGYLNNEESVTEAPTTNRKAIARIVKITATDIMKMAYIISMTLMLVVVGFAPLYKDVLGSCFYNNTNSLVGLAVTFAVAPFVYTEARMQKDCGHKGFMIALLTINSAFIVGSLLAASFTASMIYPIVVGGAYFLLMVAGLIKTKGSSFIWRNIWCLFVNLIIGAVFVVISHYISVSGWININGRDAIVRLLGLYISVQLLLFALPRTPRVWGGAFCQPFDRVEKAYEKISYRRLIKGNERINEIY